MPNGKKSPVVGVSLSPEDIARLDAFAKGATKRAAVGKQSMLIGLALIEKDPSLLNMDPTEAVELVSKTEKSRSR